MQELWDKNKGKIIVTGLTILIGFAGAFAGVEITSKGDGFVCVGVAQAEAPAE